MMKERLKALALRAAAPAILAGTMLAGKVANAQITESATDVANNTLVPLYNASKGLLYNFGVPVLLFAAAVGIGLAWFRRGKQAAKGHA